MPNILLTPNGYKSFIIDFRRRCAGRPAGIIEYSYTTAGGTVKSFRFRTNDEYLIAVKNSANEEWRQINEYEGHYAHMRDRPEPIKNTAVLSAFSTDFTRPYADWSRELRVICLFTAEAARSNAVYRPCQLTVQNHCEIIYANLWPYINGYGAARSANGLGANVFRALDNGDYR